jgi:radical SAM-linked protein
MRVRLRYSKLGKIRFTSHRDVARMWERALRRVGLPVAYTAGFSPRPRIAFGLALSTGHESLAEFLDIDLDVTHTAAIDIAGLPGRLTPALPVGIDVTAAASVPPGTPSLQESVTSSSWRIEARGLPPADADRLVAAALSAEHLVISRIRKGREVTDDLRPAVLSVSVAGPTVDGTELLAELAVHPRSVRPAELLVALSPDGLEEGRVLRTAQSIWRDGNRAEPLDATPRPHAELRAS